MPVIELADIVVSRNALYDISGSLHHIGGKLQRMGKIIGRAAGNIANGHIRSAFQNAVDRFAECAVTAGTDNHIHLRCQPLGNLLAVACSCRHMHSHVIAGSVKY